MSKRLISLLMLLALIFLSALPRPTAQAAPSTSTGSGRFSPIRFTENAGQWNVDARCQVRGSDNATWLAEDANWIPVVERTAADVGRLHSGRLARFDPEDETVSSIIQTQHSSYQARITSGSHQAALQFVRISDDTGKEVKSQPRLAVSPSGVFYAVWLDARTDPGWSRVFFSSSFDAGQTWSTNQMIGSDVTVYTSPAIAVAPNGMVYVAYADGYSHVYLINSQNEGQSWTSPLKVTDEEDHPDAVSPRVVVPADGTVMVAWIDQGLLCDPWHCAYYGSNIDWKVSSDGGETFGPKQRLVTETSYNHLSSLVTRNGLVYLGFEGYPGGAFGAYMTISQDLGATFSVPVRIDSPSDWTGVQGAPVLAVDAAGTIYATWLETYNGQVYFSKSIDSGHSFAEKLHVTTEDRCHDQHGGFDMGVAQTGAIHIVCPGSNIWGTGGLIRSISRDGGSSFSIHEVITSTIASTLTWSPSMVLTGDGDANIVWVRTAGFEPDLEWSVYYAHVPFSYMFSAVSRVTDATGHGIPGVMILDLPSRGITSDSNGYYTLPSLSDGVYTLQPAKTGYTFAPTSRTVSLPRDALAAHPFIGRLTSQIVDPRWSAISATPTIVVADGQATSTVTVLLHNAYEEPVLGKTVRLSSDRGALDVIAQPATVTNSQGIATGTVRSSTAGAATISALVYEDGVILANTATVSFEPYTPPSGEFLYRLNQVVDTAVESLGFIKEDVQEVAGYGDYFRGAIGEDAAKLGTDFAFGMMDIVGGVHDSQRLQKGVQLALPGMSKQFDGPFWPGIVNPEQTFPAASDLFRADVWNLVRHHSVASSRSELAYGGAKFLAARTRDSVLEVITEKMAKEDVKNRFVYLDDGMTTSAAPAMSNAADELGSLLDLTRDDLLANLPAMTSAYQSAWEGDLLGRTKALLVLEQQLDDERRTLVNFRLAHEQHPPELTSLLLRFGATTAAGAVFDGPGRVAVGGTLLAFDGYMDGKQLSESAQMHQLAMDTVLGTPDALRQTYSNAFSALARIGHGLPTARAIGEINRVVHLHDGRQHRSGWEETASWSEVTLTNTGDTETTYRVMAGYLADTTRFGVPWATWDLVAEREIILGPHATGTARVDYKRANGTRGLSPRSRSCCTVPSAINIQVLGTNEAGTYYIDNDYSVWEPARVSYGGVAAAGLTEDSPVIDPPLTSYVLSAPWTQRHEVQLWINNPFTTTVPVTVTQPLPANTVLLDPGGGTERGGIISWTTEVAASSLEAVTLTLGFPAPPGTINSLVPATLHLINPLDGQPDDFQSNGVEFQAIWPLTLEHVTPGYVLPGASASVVVSVTNWLTDAAVTGTLAINVTDALSTTVHTESHPFSVPIGATNAVNFSLPATLALGDYRLIGAVTTGGATAIAFTDWLQVGLPGPRLDYRSSPVGPVYAEEVINYTVQFTNTTGMPLTSAVITASLPISATLVAGSITGGGIAETGQVGWALATIAPNQAVKQSFAVRVNPDAAPAGGKTRELQSEPRLTAAEIAPTWGPMAWNLVIQESKLLYLPLLHK